MKKLQRILALVLMLCLVCASTVAMASAAIDKSKAVAVRVLTYGNLELGTELTDKNGDVWSLKQERSIPYTGSGFGVAEKGKPVQYFITNAHVISSDDFYFLFENRKTGELNLFPVPRVAPTDLSYYISYNDTSDMLPAKLESVSGRADLALLILESPTDMRPAATLRLYEEIGTEEVYVAGFPGSSEGLIVDDISNEYRSKVEDITVTSGKVSKMVTNFTTEAGDYLIIDAAVNPGNSGGPVLDKNGHVIGVATSGMTNAQNSNHAITSNEVHRFLEDNHVKHSTTSANAFFDGPLPYIIAGGIILLAVAAVLIKKLGGSTGKNRRYLVGTGGALVGQQITLKGEMMVGTNSNACQIVFPKGTPGISGRHCTIKIDKGVVTVTDIGSTYGTWIDDNKLQAGQPVVLHRGHTLKLGSPDQTFKLIS